MRKISAIPSFYAFPLHTMMPLRFSDTDQQGHVNNAVFATAYETGRVAFLYNPKKHMPPKGMQFVIAQLNISFLREIRYPADVVIGTAVTRIGTSSAQLIQALQVAGEMVSSAQSIIVLTDPKTRKSVPLPQETRAQFEKMTLKEE